MSAYHKALKGINRIEIPEFILDCSGPPSLDCWGIYNPGPVSSVEKKAEFAKIAKEEGWTYNKDGHWFCPECRKGGAD